jgi:hypothetical protein
MTMSSSFSAHANGLIDYTKELSAGEANIAGSFKNSQAYDWASLDLNNDSITELIAKPKDCGVDVKKMCSYLIFARMRLRGNQMLRKIGAIEAYNLDILSSSGSGVTELQAQTTTENDFDRETWAWNPKTSQYSKK